MVNNEKRKKRVGTMSAASLRVVAVRYRGRTGCVVTSVPRLKSLISNCLPFAVVGTEPINIVERRKLINEMY